MLTKYGVMMAVFMGVITAMAVWSYLYTTGHPG
jgi:hypothetical protein